MSEVSYLAPLVSDRVLRISEVLETTSQILATLGVCLACELAKTVSREATRQFRFVFLIRGTLMLVLVKQPLDRMVCAYSGISRR